MRPQLGPDHIPRVYNGHALVAFFDLLGFSSAVDRTWGTEQSVLQTILDLKEEIRSRRIHRLRIKLAHYDDGFRPIVRTVSDSIICIYPLVPTESANDYLYGAFTDMICVAQTASIMARDARFAIRGAIETGKIFWNDTEIIGPAFNAAYLLESKVAETARIVLGPSLLRELGTLRGEPVLQVAGLLEEDGGLVCHATLRGDQVMKELHEAAPSERAKRKYLPLLEERESIETAVTDDPHYWERLAASTEAAMDGARHS